MVAVVPSCSLQHSATKCHQWPQVWRSSGAQMHGWHRSNKCGPEKSQRFKSRVRKTSNRGVRHWFHAWTWHHDPPSNSWYLEASLRWCYVQPITGDKVDPALISLRKHHTAICGWWLTYRYIYDVVLTSNHLFFWKQNQIVGCNVRSCGNMSSILK